MPQKRARANHNEVKELATTYFIDMMRGWTPTNARAGSLDEDIILDAHQWGEARVRAQLNALQLLGVAARSRYNALTNDGEKWYAAGYSIYLLPNSRDAPEALRSRLRTNDELMGTSEQARRELPGPAASAWRKKFAQALFDEARAAADAEDPPARAASPSRSVASPATAPTSSLHTRGPLAPLPPPPAGPPLPPTLARLLEDPTERIASAPRAGVEQAVTEALRNQRTLRAWGDDLTYPDKMAYDLQREVDARGLRCMYGDMADEVATDAMRRAGLKKLASGAYNKIWVADDRTAPWLRAMFTKEVGNALCEGQLVLRTPKPNASWLSFDEAVGEASNMLFTALCGFGPRVALLSFATRLFPDKDAGEEGLLVPGYRLFVVLERAQETVDKRYAPDVLPVASTTADRLYAKALLVCVFHFSHEGYVHLDSTLRNFVDCYPHNLINHKYAEWCVKTIDVDKKTFRRLCPEASTDWRDLFLINLLVVFTFLKQRLGARWDRERHWASLARPVTQLMRDLVGRATLPAIAFWEGPFNPDEKFPEVEPSEYVECTHKSSARFLLRQMRYYMLRQPFEQCDVRYLRFRLAQAASPQELQAAQHWYDNDYRSDTYPAHCFFRDALQPRDNGKPRLFARVLYEYLNTPFAELKSKYAHALPPSNAHTVFGGTIGRERMLGLVVE